MIRHECTKCAGCLVFIAFAIVSCESADTQAPATRPASGPGGSQAGLRLSATSSPSTLPAEAYVERLIVQLGSYSRETQEEAVKDLVKIGRAAVPQLMAVAADEYEDRTVRGSAVVALARGADPRCKPVLIQLLRSDYDYVRWMASWGVASIGGQDASDALRGYFWWAQERESSADLSAADEALQRLPGIRSVLMLLRIHAQRTKSDGMAWRSVVKDLGRTGDPSVSEALARELLSNEDFELPGDYQHGYDYLFLEAIEQTRGPAAIPHLVAYLRKLVADMKGQDASKYVVIAGREARQARLNRGIYQRTLRILESMTGHKSKGLTREDVAADWAGWVKREYKPLHSATQAATLAAEPDSPAWYELPGGFSAPVGGLRIRVNTTDTPAVLARGIPLSIGIDFENESDKTLLLRNPSCVQLRWELVDSTGMIVKPSEKRRLVAEDPSWYTIDPKHWLGPGAGTGKFAEGARVDLQSAKWQLKPGKYVFRGWYSQRLEESTPPKQPADRAQKGTVWTGTVELPPVRFEVFRNVTDQELRERLSALQKKRFASEISRWRAVAKLLVPGMTVRQMKMALPPRDGPGGVHFRNSLERYAISYRLDRELAVRVRGYKTGNRDDRMFLGHRPRIMWAAELRPKPRSTQPSSDRGSAPATRAAN